MRNKRLIVQVIQFLWKKKEWWLIPLIILMLVLGIFIVLIHSHPVLFAAYMMV